MRRDDLPATAATAPSPRATADVDAAWRAIHRAACAPYRHDNSISSRWAWHWARGKLGRDPVFRGMLQRGDFPAAARVVDIGCGQGLVAQLLQACEQQADTGAWPHAWAAAPTLQSYHGIELMAGDATRGHRALQRLREQRRDAQIVCADMRQAPLPPCDVVVVLDVLHYVDHAAQDDVLRRIRTALQPRGRLLLRVGDPQATARSRISLVVDWIVTTARGHSVPPTWTRSLDDWTLALNRLGFGAVQRVPMSQGTPFANVLLVAE